MRCLLVAADPGRVEPYAGILSAEGYEVDARVAGAVESVLGDDGAMFPIAFVDIALGIDGVRSLCAAFLASNTALPPLVAVIGEPATEEEVDAVIGLGVSMYVEDDAVVFKKRVRFLRRALRVRTKAAKLMAEVRDSELHYRTVVAALDEGLIVQQHDGVVSAINPAAGRILGISDDEVRALRWRDPDWHIVDQDGERVPVDALPAARALRGGEPVRGCVLGVGRPDGSRVWVSVNSHPVKQNGPAPVAVVTTFSDVTARRRAEEQFLELLESAPDAVLVHREGKTVWANKKWVALLGYDDGKALVGKPILDFVSPRFKTIVSERVNRAYRGQATTPSLEQAFVRRDGTEVQVVVFGVVTVFRGQPALAAFARDRTEQRRLEVELMAADRLAALGRLAAGVGHEINNPLSYVIGNMQIASERLRCGDACDALERLDEAMDGAERIRLIVRDLKVFGPHAPESLTAVDVHRVVDSCARVAESEIRVRAKLVRDFRQVPPALANEPRLAQIVLNLLVNAMQSLPEDRVDANVITVSTRLDVDGRVALSISDTGVGIEPENLARVVEPFFTTKADKGGTGLGLSICNMLVADQGGELGIESELGRGTTVTVRLRAAEANPG